jgi:hypothetical protein
MVSPGFQGFTLEVRALKALRSLTIQGTVPAEIEAPLNLTASANGQSWSCQVDPGLPFRWGIPFRANSGTHIVINVNAEPNRHPAQPTDCAIERGAALRLEQLSFDPDIEFIAEHSGVVLSTVLLSFNRPDLLRRTLESYLATVSVPYELIIVDNNSDETTRQLIAEMSERHPTIEAILLAENLGGAAINLGVAQSRGHYIHISENDLEYLPGWDQTLLTKLEVFPKLGQLSVVASGSHEVRPWTVDGLTVHLARHNVMTPSVMPREVYEAGVRWTTRGEGNVLFPADGRFSHSVKEHGYLVAWNDADLVINHGFEVAEYIRRLPYYIANYLAKPPPEGGIEVLAARLRAGGYRLEQDASGEWTATPMRPRPQ